MERDLRMGIEKLHDFRKEIDAVIQKALYFKGGEPEIDQTQFIISENAGREMSLVYTKLQEAKMWAGKCLEQLGSEMPKELQDKAN